MRLILESGVLTHALTIVDPGCGDGVLLSALAKTYPHAKLTGIEHGFALAMLARMRFALSRRRVRIIHGDMFTYPLHNADAIVGWWIPDLTPRLVEKFVSECKPGCVIISTMFTLPPHPQLHMEEKRDGKYSIFIYRKQ
jgi:trans-aconitate methyltransferase